MPVWERRESGLEETFDFHVASGEFLEDLLEAGILCQGPESEVALFLNIFVGGFLKGSLMGPRTSWEILWKVVGRFWRDAGIC